MLHLKRSSLILMLLLIHSRTEAQGNFYEPAPKVFTGGLVAGLNFTQVDGDTFYGYQKAGINAGGLVYVHFSEVTGLSMELIYSQKGSRGELVTQSAINGTYVQKYFMNLNYAEVPVTFHVISHKFDFEAGISFARLINSSEWVESDQPVTIDPVANRFKTSDVDYVFGLARKLYKRWYANARFQYSITSIRPTDRVPAGFSWGNNGQFNNLLNLRIMYLF